MIEIINTLPQNHSRLRDKRNHPQLEIPIIRNYATIITDIFHGVEGTTLFLRSVIISENPLDEYTRSFPVEKLDRIAEKHRLIGSWREFILQFHPARKPDAARCLSRREFRVDGF